MYRIAIIEDNEEQRAHLSAMVNASSTASRLEELPVSVPADGAFSRAALAEAFQADIVMLDINLGLPDHTGISLVESILPADSAVQIIYVSGYLEYVSDVYRTPHAWFLPKPVQQEDLNQALERAVSNLNAQLASPLIIKSKGALARIYPQRILYIESDRRKVSIVERDRVTEAYAKISDIEGMLPAEFARCHKSFLVNMSYIVELAPKSITLIDGATVPVSQRCRKELQERFLRYAGRAV